MNAYEVESEMYDAVSSFGSDDNDAPQEQEETTGSDE